MNVGISFNLLSLNCSLSQIKEVSATKNSMQCSANTMQEEITEDEARTGHRQVDKRQQLSDLNGRISDASSQISEKLSDVNKDISDSSKAAAKNKDNDNSTSSAGSENGDTVSVNGETGGTASVNGQNTGSVTSASNNTSKPAEKPVLTKRVFSDSEKLYSPDGTLSGNSKAGLKLNIVA